MITHPAAMKRLSMSRNSNVLETGSVKMMFNVFLCLVFTNK